jgi:hypothetical protein
MNQAALLVDTSWTTSADKTIQLMVITHKVMKKMKMTPTLSTIVQKKAILQEKTMMMNNLCISRDFRNFVVVYFNYATTIVSKF